jgi:phage gp36-like protein
MPYVTPQALIDRFGEHEIVQLTDRATPRNQAVDDAVAQLACDRAGAEIDGYVGARYTLPLASTPELLTLLALDVARYHLFEMVEPPTVVRDRYKEATRTLEAIRDGKQPLGADLAGAAIVATPAALPDFAPGAKDFARGHW